MIDELEVLRIKRVDFVCTKGHKFTAPPTYEGCCPNVSAAGRGCSGRVSCVKVESKKPAKRAGKK
jgi:hypothetical protein